MNSSSLPVLYQARKLVEQGNYAVSGIAALLTFSSPIAHVHYFAGPILLFLGQSHHSQFLPESLVRLVHLSRLDLIIIETIRRQVGDLATAADVLAFFYSLKEAGDLPKEWRAVYKCAAKLAQATESPNRTTAARLNRDNDGLKLRRGLRAEIVRQSIRDQIVTVPWHEKPFDFDSRPLFFSGNISLRHVGLTRQPAPEWRVVTWKSR